MTASNKGLIQQKFKDIRLRVRGIQSKEVLGYWAGNEPRLNFPSKIVDNKSILPKDYNFFLCRAGHRAGLHLRHESSHVSGYLLVHAEFEDDAFTPHTTERVFTVKAGNSMP